MKDHHNDTWWIDGTDKYLAFLKPKSSILDIGCGAGNKANYLSNKGFKVTGIDFSKKIIELAKEQVPQVNFYTKDIKQPLNMEEQFEGIFLQAVLLHIPKMKLKK